MIDARISATVVSASMITRLGLIFWRVLLLQWRWDGNGCHPTGIRLVPVSVTMETCFLDHALDASRHAANPRRGDNPRDLRGRFFEPTYAISSCMTVDLK